jgi:hypothetical protein
MKLVIEVRNVEGNVYQASLVRGEPELNVGGAINVSCREQGYIKAAERLMELLRTLGWKGSFVVNYEVVEEFPSKTKEPDPSKTATLPIESFKNDRAGILSRPGKYYDVSYNPDREHPYECTCEHFVHRLDGTGDYCKHIDRAINVYRFGIK